MIIHNERFKNKPNIEQVKRIQKTWNNSIETNDYKKVAIAFQNGQTVKFNEKELNTVIIDCDKQERKSLGYINKKLKEHNLGGLIYYETFSSDSTKEIMSFRIIYSFKERITKEQYLNITKEIERILEIKLDYAFALNSKQICYGTNKEVYYISDYKEPLLHTLKASHLEGVIDADNIRPYKTYVFNQNINDLENMETKQFYEKINKILNTNSHISYDLGLRLYFCNFSNEKIQKKVLELVSVESKKTILENYQKYGFKYALRLIQFNGNFYKIYKYNQQKMSRKKGLVIE